MRQEDNVVEAKDDDKDEKEEKKDDDVWDGTLDSDHVSRDNDEGERSEGGRGGVGRPEVPEGDDTSDYEQWQL